MNKLIVILSSIVLVIALTFGGIYYLKSRTATGLNVTVPTQSANYFPSSGNRNNENPDSSTGNPGSSDHSGQPATAVIPTLVSIGNLKEVSNRPIAGASIINLNGTSTPVFIEKETGNLYALNEKAGTIARMTDTSLPKIYQVFWGQDKSGARIIARYLVGDNIDNYSAVIKTSTTSQKLGELTGSSINPNIFDLSISPAGDKIFYLTAIDQSAAGLVTDFDLKKQSPIFQSPYTEWASRWPNDNIITLETKPASRIDGYLYTLNPKNSELKKVLGGLPGLEAVMSPDGKKVIYSTNDIGHSLHLFNVATKSDIILGLDTFAEKCVWTKDSKKAYCAAPVTLANYPLDDWFQGKVSFNDNLWEIAIDTASLKQIYSFSSSPSKISIDAINLFLNKAGDSLFFTNKIDATLWMIYLKETLPVSAIKATTTSTSTIK